MSKSGLDKLAI